MSELKQAAEQETIKTLWSDGKSVDDYICKPNDVAIFNLFEDIQCLKEDIEGRDAEIVNLKELLNAAAYLLENCTIDYYDKSIDSDIEKYREAAK